MGGVAEVIMYSRHNGSLSYGFEFKPSRSIVDLMAGAAALILKAALAIPMTQSLQGPIIKEFSTLRRHIKGNPYINFHGMSRSDGMQSLQLNERHLLKADRHLSRTEVMDILLQVAQCSSRFVSDDNPNGIPQ